VRLTIFAVSVRIVQHTSEQPGTGGYQRIPVGTKRETLRPATALHECGHDSKPQRGRSGTHSQTAGANQEGGRGPVAGRPEETPRGATSSKGRAEGPAGSAQEGSGRSTQARCTKETEGGEAIVVERLYSGQEDVRAADVSSSASRTRRERVNEVV
jgi:hypothetical protein